MDVPNQPTTTNGKRIIIEPDGPYIVKGGVPLVSKSQVVSEHGEPLTWRKEGTLETADEYELCRCGQSSQKPFCDRTHRLIDVDGTETADTGPGNYRPYPGSTGIVVRKDPRLCISAGFCGTRNAGIRDLAAATDNTEVRSLVIAMVERCPSGSLTYRMEPDGPDIEPDLPQQIADTTEMTSEGPIAGPLWVSGGIPIERADGQPFETRNRVALCNCGKSRNKPLCDGTHRFEAERVARQRRLANP